MHKKVEIELLLKKNISFNKGEINMNSITNQIENIIAKNTFIYQRYQDTNFTEYTFDYNIKQFPPILIIQNKICEFPTLHKKFNIIKHQNQINILFNTYFKDINQFSKVYNQIIKGNEC